MMASKEALRSAIDQAKARKAEIRLERARENAEAERAACKTLIGFIRNAWTILEPSKPFVSGWMLDAMADLLERVSRGQIQYLLMNVPPGSMKSLMMVFWTAWEWGPFGRPDLSYLATSYSKDNLDRDADKIRKLISSEWYRTLWPEVAIRQNRNAIDLFELTGGGWYDSRPFKSMTGGRADRTKIDDPHSVDGAESEVQRAATIRTFREGLSDRLNDLKSSVMVVIMQRVHEGDVSGLLMELQIGFVHFCVPMEYDPARHCEIVLDGEVVFSDPRRESGQVLMFPDRFPQTELNRLRLLKGEYAWAAQYDQLPAPRQGGMFPVEKITTAEYAPPGGEPCRGWDIAGSTKKTSPYTAGVRIKLMPNRDVWVLNVVRDRLKIGAAEDLIVATAEQDGLFVKQSIPQDPGSAGLSQKNQIAGRLAGLQFHFSTETGAKEDRAIPIASQVQAGKVYMVKGPWNAEFIAELRSFPSGSYKDQVDALSRAYSELIGVKSKRLGLAGPKVA